MAEVCEGAPVAVSGWVLADGHDARPCAASGLHRGTMSVSDMIGGTGKLGMAQASDLIGHASTGQCILRAEGTLPQRVVS